MEKQVFLKSSVIRKAFRVAMIVMLCSVFQSQGLAKQHALQQRSKSDMHDETKATKLLDCVTLGLPPFESSTFRVQVKEIPVAGTSGLPNYKVEMLRTSGSSARLIYSYKSDYEYSGVHELGGHLVAILFASEDGHVRTSVFQLAKNHVAKVLEIWGYGDPDFVAGYMLNSTGRTMKGDCILPTQTEIYSTDGTRPKLLRTVTYNDRFEALSQIVRAEEARQATLPCCGSSPGCPE